MKKLTGRTTSLWQLQGISYGAGDAIMGLKKYLLEMNLLANSEKFKDVPVLLHTDHIKGSITREILSQAVSGLVVDFEDETIKLSPSSISLDASELTPNENIELLNYFIETSILKGRRITLEMEAGVDDGFTSEKEIKSLICGVEDCHPGYIHLFAPGLGTKHGNIGKGFPNFSAGKVKKNVEFINSLIGRKIGLALHGSSGLTKRQLVEAATNGVVKVNWSSDSLFTRAKLAKQYYSSNWEKFNIKHKDVKSAIMDNGVNSYVSNGYVPLVQNRIETLQGKQKNKGFWKWMNQTQHGNLSFEIG